MPSHSQPDFPWRPSAKCRLTGLTSPHKGIHPVFRRECLPLQCFLVIWLAGNIFVSACVLNKFFTWHGFLVIWPTGNYFHKCIYTKNSTRHVFLVIWPAGSFHRRVCGANRGILGPKLLFVMGCVKTGEKIAFICLLWVNKTQINYPISRNPWEVIILDPVLFGTSLVLDINF